MLNLYRLPGNPLFSLFGARNRQHTSGVINAEDSELLLPRQHPGPEHTQHSPIAGRLLICYNNGAKACWLVSPVLSGTFNITRPDVDVSQNHHPPFRNRCP